MIASSSADSTRHGSALIAKNLDQKLLALLRIERAVEHRASLMVLLDPTHEDHKAHDLKHGDSP